VGCTCYADKPVRTLDHMLAQYYVLLDVADKPGVLASVAGAFGGNNVSIKSVWQEGFGDHAQLVLITHRAMERDFQATLSALRDLDTVTKVASVMRVEGPDE
jgi:homoserine dehydrogenase